MKLKTLLRAILASLLTLAAVNAQSNPIPNMPHLERRGIATQLIVDNRHYLILGGEVSNTASSSLEYMKTVWPRLARMNLNTVLVAMAWAWIEPEEGKFDFTLVDGLLEGARQHNMRIIYFKFEIQWVSGILSVGIQRERETPEERRLSAPLGIYRNHRITC